MTSLRRCRALRARLLGIVAVGLLSACAWPATEARRPNIVLVLADDLGYGELGSYGQERIRTPRLDRIAAEGIRFTQHYSGSPVCAPSRGSLLTGLHTGHAYIRDNDEMPERGDIWYDLDLEGQRPLPEGTTTLATMLRDAGYRTGAMGKWGLGGPGSSGEPGRQGFDRWYGYLGQRVAHNYYPPHLWSDATREPLAGNDYFHPHQRFPEGADPTDEAAYAGYAGETYAQDRIIEEALAFIDASAGKPFFLFLPFTIPHLALQVPEEDLAPYLGAFEETPYLGDAGYLPHPTPRAAYAAMISRLDRDVGRIQDRLVDHGIDRDTVLLFTSDNGASWVGGVDLEFFASNRPLRGRKQQLYEGGIRVPLIVRWPGRIEAGAVTDHLSAFWDYMPTLAEVAGVESPPTDGISFLRTLLGENDQAAHAYLYWEFAGRQALRLDHWKAYRPGVDAPVELYDLAADLAESTDVAAREPDMVGRIERILSAARTESELFPLRR